MDVTGLGPPGDSSRANLEQPSYVLAGAVVLILKVKSCRGVAAHTDGPMSPAQMDLTRGHIFVFGFEVKRRQVLEISTKLAARLNLILKKVVTNAWVVINDPSGYVC